MIAFITILVGAKILLGVGVGAAAGTVGVLALLAWFGSSSTPKKKKKKKVDDGPISSCPPLPALNMDEVQTLVAQATEQGLLGLMPFVSFIARTLYPTKSDGTAINWPTKAPYNLPPNADGSLHCRWEEIKRVLGELNPPVPEPETPTVADVISDLLLPYPLPGHFYQVVKNDGLDKIARAALNNLVPGSGDKFQTGRLAYIKQCINKSAAWNLPLYGGSSTSEYFPGYYLTDGKGLRSAFFPWHQSGVAMLLAGVMPKRAVNATGSAKIPAIGQGMYGLIWLPPVDEKVLAEFGNPICTGTWADGSPVTDPPPELMSLIKPQ